MKRNKQTALTLAVGSAIAASLAAVSATAAENPFAAQSLGSGYMVASNHGNKAMEGKCGEGKCGGSKTQTKTKSQEGKCGEGKCGSAMKAQGDAKKAEEGKTSAEKAGSKAKEGKCGEGKCGNMKK
jgi:uncharacterized low-complexity protein